MAFSLAKTAQSRLDCSIVQHRLVAVGDAIDMCSTCNHAYSMSTMIQIRNVPEALHRELKSRAAREGMSLSDYLLREIRHVAERPTLEEMRARLHSRPRC